MAMYHFVYTFPVDQFQIEVEPIIARLENGFVQPLYDRATSIYKEALQLDRKDRIPTILDDHNLYYWESSPPLDSLDEEDIRVLLTILLVNNLSFCESSLGEHWGLFENALTGVGWSREDAALLVYGLPMPYLLRPKCFPTGRTFHSLVETKQYRKEPPRWQWLGGAMDGGAGWLSQDMIRQLWDKVLVTKNLIIEASDQTLAAIFGESAPPSAYYAPMYGDTAPSKDRKEFLLGLLEGMQSALASAKEKGEGLFLAISG